MTAWTAEPTRPKGYSTQQNVLNSKSWLKEKGRTLRDMALGFPSLLGAPVAARRLLLLGRRRRPLKTSLEGTPVNMGDKLSKEPFSVVYKKPIAKKVDQVPEMASTHPYKPDDFQGTAKEPAKGTCKDFQASADARKRL